MIGGRFPFGLAALVAVVGSAAVHAGMAALNPAPDDEVLIEGGAQIAALGSSFENLVRAGDRLSPVEAEAAQPTNTPIETATPVTPERIEPASPVRTPTPPKPTPKPTTQVALATVTAPVPVTQSQAPTPAIAALAPDKVPAAEPVSPIDVIEALPDQPVLPSPQARPFRQVDADRARAERQRQVESTSQAARQRQARGAAQSNANRNARAGRTEGNEAARGASNRQGSKSASQAGNAAASNYPGRVYAKIRRTRQKRIGGRGTVRVRFAVSGDGGLAGASVAASSGNPTVDQAAVDHVRRAAPFPAPPHGAQTRFVIPIEIRR